MCSCAIDLAAWPEDGATEIPLNVAIVVRDRVDMAVELSSSGGALSVDIERVERQSSYQLDVVRPSELLAPATTYTLVVGERVSTFTTADGTDDDPPDAVAIRDVHLAHAQVREGVSPSCGEELHDFDLDVTVPADVVMLRVGIDDVTHVFDAETVREQRFDARNAGCGPQVDLARGAETCVTVEAIDAAGNVGPTTTRCAEVVACAPVHEQTRDLDGCEVEQGGGCAVAGDGTLAIAIVVMGMWGRARAGRGRRTRGRGRS